LALGEKFVKEENLFRIIDTWLSSQFAGGRHQRRVEKIELTASPDI
jgi:ribose 5-phosphate isomerase RpiB